MREITLKLSEEAFSTIKDHVDANPWGTRTDGAPIHAWLIVVDAILDGKTEIELKTKKEREDEACNT